MTKSGNKRVVVIGHINHDRIWRLTWLGLAPSADGADSGDCGAL